MKQISMHIEGHAQGLRDHRGCIVAPSLRQISIWSHLWGWHIVWQLSMQCCSDHHWALDADRHT